MLSLEQTVFKSDERKAIRTVPTGKLHDVSAVYHAVVSNATLLFLPGYSPGNPIRRCGGIQASAGTGVLQC